MALGAVAVAVGLVAALLLRSAQLLRRQPGPVARRPNPCPSRVPLEELSWSQVAGAVLRRSGSTRQRREVAGLPGPRPADRARGSRAPGERSL